VNLSETVVFFCHNCTDTFSCVLVYTPLVILVPSSRACGIYGCEQSSDVITKPPSSCRHGHCRAGSLSLCPPSLSRCTSSEHDDVSSSALTTVTPNSSTSDMLVGKYATVPRCSAVSTGLIMNASDLLADGRSTPLVSSVSDSVKSIVASVRPAAIDNSLLVTQHSRVCSSSSV